MENLYKFSPLHHFHKRTCLLFCLVGISHLNKAFQARLGEVDHIRFHETQLQTTYPQLQPDTEDLYCTFISEACFFEANNPQIFLEEMTCLKKCMIRGHYITNSKLSAPFMREMLQCYHTFGFFIPPKMVTLHRDHQAQQLPTNQLHLMGCHGRIVILLI